MLPYSASMERNGDDASGDRQKKNLEEASPPASDVGARNRIVDYVSLYPDGRNRHCLSEFHSRKRLLRIQMGGMG